MSEDMGKNQVVDKWRCRHCGTFWRACCDNSPDFLSKIDPTQEPLPVKPKLYTRFVLWLRRFEERPHYNRFGAGLSAMLWARWCGHDWKFARHLAAIYWFGK